MRLVLKKIQMLCFGTFLRNWDTFANKEESVKNIRLLCPANSWMNKKHEWWLQSWNLKLTEKPKQTRVII